MHSSSVVPVSVVLVLASTVPSSSLVTDAEVVFYLGDPQIGFSGNASLDTLRFSIAAQAAAAHPQTAATVVAGDLVNVWNNSTQIELYKSVWRQNPGWWQVPGNHDVNSELTSVDDVLAALQHYRSVFGAAPAPAQHFDYSSTSTRFASLIMVNSEMLILPYLGLNGTTDQRILEPVEQQWQWLETELASAAAASDQRPHVVRHCLTVPASLT